ncbi:MAG: hypothetical protein [Bacteriophage sp.]|nr:MAG: hypothetical protein [Bacteriophage sp.]
MTQEEVQEAFDRALGKVFGDRVIERLDTMFQLLDAGVPPSNIAGLEHCDTEELVQFLCKYHHAKMKQAGHK